MSSDNSANSNSNQTKPPSPPPSDMQRNRRGSITMPLVNIFQRSNSVAGVTPVYPGSIATAAANQRRLSLSQGLAGTSPTTANLARRASLSTNSSDYDENVIEEEDYSTSTRVAPVTPFTARRVSFGTAAGMRRPSANSPGTSNGRPTAHSTTYTTTPLADRSGNSGVSRTPHDSAVTASASATSWKSPPSNTTQMRPMPSNVSVPPSRPRATSVSDYFTPRSDQGFNWSEQLRSRAESTVSGSRPSFSFASGLTGSPPRPGAVPPPGGHDRHKSVSEMPAPPAQAPKPRTPPRDNRPKPDHFQERILKGDFYMD